MFVSLKANKNRIVAFVILALAVVGAWFFLRKDSPEPETRPVEAVGETEQERLDFLQSFGWTVDAQAVETREVMIPAQFNDVYENYNAMQQAQGFDLRPYAGEVCTQYKYHITNYPGETEVYATLLVRGRFIIGGDVACSKASGFMHGFAKDSARYGEATPQPAASTQPEVSPESAGAGDSSESNYVNSQPVENGEEAGGNVENPVENVGNSASEGQESAEESAESTNAEVEDGYPTD